MTDIHHIAGLPPSAWYIPNFISEAEEEYLLRKVSHIAFSVLNLRRSYSGRLQSRLYQNGRPSHLVEGVYGGLAFEVSAEVALADYNI